MKNLVLTALAIFLALPSAYCQPAVVDSLIEHMSIRRKIAQLMVVTADSRYGEARQREENHCVRDEQIGGIILMGKELDAAIARTNFLQGLSELPLLEFTDAEWGAAMRVTGFKPFPKQGYLARHCDESLVYRMGLAVAAELRQLKIQVNFAPDVDINVNPDNIVIGERSFGSDRELVARLGSAYARGMQDGGIIACAKHFPGHGDTSVDSHKGLPVLDFSYDRLDSLELYPFRRLVSDASADMLMVGHLCAPALDPSGTPASLSKEVITGFLRSKMGFRGLVVCDALNMQSILKLFPSNPGPSATLAAYEAGVDILLMPTDVSGALDLIESSIKSGRLSEDDLDERVRKVLMAKWRMGLLDKNYDRFVDPSKIDTESSAAILDEIYGR